MFLDRVRERTVPTDFRPPSAVKYIPQEKDRHLTIEPYSTDPLCLSRSLNFHFYQTISKRRQEFLPQDRLERQQLDRCFRQPFAAVSSLEVVPICGLAIAHGCS